MAHAFCAWVIKGKEKTWPITCCTDQVNEANIKVYITVSLELKYFHNFFLFLLYKKSGRTCNLCMYSLCFVSSYTELLHEYILVDSYLRM